MKDGNHIHAGHGPRRFQVTRTQPWEPSVRDLEIYAGLVEGRSTRQLADKFGLSHQSIQQIGHKIDAWLAPQWMDRVRGLKAQHTGFLMVIFREQMEAWRESKKDSFSQTVTTTSKGGKQTVTRKRKTVTRKRKTVTRKRRAGNPSHLKVARAALADIRRIWGADAAKPAADDTWRQ